MKILIAIFCTFLIITTPTSLQQEFEEVIDKNYEKYYYLINEETSVGDVVIVVGSIKKDVYVSGFIFNTTNMKHYFKLSNKDMYENSFYKVKVEQDMKISIVSNTGTFITYDIEYNSIEKLNELELITGEGKNNFPIREKTTDMFDIFKIGIFIFLGIIGILTVILLSLYRNKKGLFEINNQNITNYSFDNIIEIEPEIEEPKTKEELMQEAYDAFNKGQINESELNNRLRRIWWSEDD